MRKFIFSLVAALLFSATSNAEVVIGVSGALMGFETTGSETLKSSSNVTSATKSEEVAVPSIFIELRSEAGVAFGLDYIPMSAEIGAESKTKDDTDTDDSSDTSGTNKAAAEISNHVTAYINFPLASSGVYLKAGYIQVTIDTTESLATGTTYGNADINGVLGGIGYEHRADNGILVRAEGSYTDYEDVDITGSTDDDSVSSKIHAEPEA